MGGSIHQQSGDQLMQVIHGHDEVVRLRRIRVTDYFIRLFSICIISDQGHGGIRHTAAAVSLSLLIMNPGSADWSCPETEWAVARPRVGLGMLGGAVARLGACESACTLKVDGEHGSSLGGGVI